MTPERDPERPTERPDGRGRSLVDGPVQAAAFLTVVGGGQRPTPAARAG